MTDENLGERPPLKAEDLSIEIVEIDAVAPHPENPRQGDIGALTESLVAHGQYAPLIVQTATGRILAGNHRWLAAKALGWSTIGVTFVDVDDDEALRILVADNRLSDLASYDRTSLADVLASIAEVDPSLFGTGWDPDAFDDLLSNLDGSIPLPDPMPSPEPELDGRFLVSVYVEPEGFDEVWALIEPLGQRDDVELRVVQ